VINPNQYWKSINPIRLYQPCRRELIREQSVKVLNIEEGMQGEDELTYLCPHCGEEHTSVRLG
jgi:hypothetical protein